MSDYSSSTLAHLEGLSDYLRKHYQDLHNSQAQAVVALKTIFVYLQRKYPDLRVIEISYHGSGDSGQVEDIVFNPSSCIDLDTEAKLEIPDESMPDELSFGRKHKGGHWDMERREWINDAPDSNPSLTELLDSFAWDLAYGQNPGFEINEGGYGTIVISGESSTVDEVTIELSHHEIIETTNDYEYSF